MVSYKTILASNRRNLDAHPPLQPASTTTSDHKSTSPNPRSRIPNAKRTTAVFAGGTSGIGLLTLHALVRSLSNTGMHCHIYLIGRPSARARIAPTIASLESSNPNSEIIFVPGEISLLAEVARICELIKQSETRVDLLFLSAGFAPLGPRVETEEGIEVAGSLEYYGRVLFVLKLLPLLRAADAGRVVSVLGGGMEWVHSVNLADLELRKPGSWWNGVRAQPQYIAMNTLALDRLAEEEKNRGVTFVHAHPGFVDTGNVRRSSSQRGWLMGWLIWMFLEPLIWLLSYTDEESGERFLFVATSGKFGGRGTPWTGDTGVNTKGEKENGLFLVSHRCECTPNQKVMPVLRARASESVWKHTWETLRAYL